jgi:hypothetical protein
MKILKSYEILRVLKFYENFDLKKKNLNFLKILIFYMKFLKF